MTRRCAARRSSSRRRDGGTTKPPLSTRAAVAGLRKPPFCVAKLTLDTAVGPGELLMNGANGARSSRRRRGKLHYGRSSRKPNQHCRNMSLLLFRRGHERKSALGRGTHARDDAGRSRARMSRYSSQPCLVLAVSLTSAFSRRPIRLAPSVPQQLRRLRIVSGSAPSIARATREEKAMRSLTTRAPARDPQVGEHEVRDGSPAQELAEGPGSAFSLAG